MQMTKGTKLLVAVLLVALGGTGIALIQSNRRAAEQQTSINLLQNQRDDLQHRLEPLETKQRAVRQIKQEFVVAAGTIQPFEFSPAITPGTLTGSWRSSGQGFGGADDTIAGFRLSDPKDSLLASDPRGSSGRFLVKVSGPGKYTFFFDNSGILRSTPRRVFLDAEFRPD